MICVCIDVFVFELQIISMGIFSYKPNASGTEEFISLRGLKHVNRRLYVCSDCMGSASTGSSNFIYA